MKVFRALVLLVLLLGPFTVLASGPDDDYVGIYNLIQRGDVLNERGETDLALAKYAEAQNALTRFQATYPDWNLKIVNYRLRYLATQIADLSNRAKSASAATNAPPVQNPTPASVPSVGAPLLVAAPPASATTMPAPVKPPPLSESETQIKGLQEQISRMEADNASLQAKLKEAFAAQPAAVSPEELSRAHARIVELQKQNDLLQASLAESKTATGGSGKASEQLKRDLAEANLKVQSLTAANTALQSDKQALQTRIQSLSAGSQDVAALKSENDLLKKDLADWKARAAAAPTADTNSIAKLQEAQAQLAVLQSEKDVLQKEKAALETQLKTLSAAPALAAGTNAPASSADSTRAAGTPDSASATRMAQLEAERAELQKSLDAATRDVAGRKKGKILAARMDELTREVAGLKAHIVVLESSPVPYTPDELDLLGKPATVLVGASAHRPKKPRPELSPAAADQVKEAQSLFVAQKYDQAEQKFEAVLATNPTNVMILADLASVQVEAGHFAEAEQNLKEALTLDPDDDYTLYILGQAKFREKDYDGALNALSRAAEISPKNAQIRNSIGLALDEKGLHSEAETAFRRAIQMDPDYAEAHMNLAVVYATQKPPLIQLAKWHYQKAMAIGHAPNPGLEKMLDDVTHASAAAAAH